MCTIVLLLCCLCCYRAEPELESTISQYLSRRPDDPGWTPDAGPRVRWTVEVRSQGEQPGGGRGVNTGRMNSGGPRVSSQGVSSQGDQPHDDALVHDWLPEASTSSSSWHTLHPMWHSVSTHYETCHFLTRAIPYPREIKPTLFCKNFRGLGLKSRFTSSAVINIFHNQYNEHFTTMLLY